MKNFLGMMVMSCLVFSGNPNNNSNEWQNGGGKLGKNPKTRTLPSHYKQTINPKPPTIN